MKINKDTKYTQQEIRKICFQIAETSQAKKRKVSAVIVHMGYIKSTGVNYNPKGEGCEDEHGNTKKEVIHAEIAAINEYLKIYSGEYLIFPFHTFMYVTFEPCSNCKAVLKDYGLRYTVITEFMKFDDTKLRFDLIPTEVTTELAKILTYGANKYKPNNWKNCDDISRYIAALMRHLEKWRSGKDIDSESGFSHLSHLLTNAAFLVYFNQKNKNKHAKDSNKT